MNISERIAYGPDGAGSGTGDGDPAAAPAGDPKAAADAAAGNGSTDAASPDPFAELGLDPDTREWLGKRELIKDGVDVKTLATSAAKLAHEQAKLLGNAIRVPGKDAKPEEREEYLNKLGRPATADEYKFKVPEKLPENLPYDGERAKEFASVAHKAGLTKDQAQAIHDWATENAVGDFNTADAARKEQLVSTAKAETEKLIKMWGPMDSSTFKANIAFADKVLAEADPEVVDALKERGFIGEEGSVVLHAGLAKLFSKLGQAIFKEDGVLRGTADRIDNPFAEGEKFNITSQMMLIRENRPLALSMIAAAGKKPSDFGLKT